jgi:hypothetical protein
MQTETDVMNLCRMRAQECGAVLWRNNNGALKDMRGIPVRFGLANDSKNINAVFKSSDLIGMTSRPLARSTDDVLMAHRPDWVRVAPGLFFAVECKEPLWSYRGTEEEKAQLNYIRFVRDAGGVAGFARHPDDVSNLLGGGHGCAIAG